MISLHIVVDFCPQERLDRALLYLTRTQQKTVNIAGGAQLDLAMQYVERVRAALPNIVIMFRILEDTGIVIKLAPQEWFARYVTPRLEWLQKNRVVLVIDNETSGDDKTIETYVERESLILDMLHTVKLNGGVCRFATGNIAENQYTLLKPLFAHLHADDWVTPNEYSNVSPRSSGGHLARYKLIEDIAGHPLNIAIGEAGILVDYKARAGYRGINMSGRDMAAQMLSEEMWYRGGSIPRHAYCIGGNSDWSSLQIGDDALELWEDYYAKNPIRPVKIVPPVVVGNPSPPTLPVIPPTTPAPPAIPVTPSPPPETMITLPLSVLKAIRASLFIEANSTRSLALQLGGISDELLGNVQILDALTQKALVNAQVK